MTAGDARHGRRDNGLTAAEYAAVGDVDPRVGEHLLDVFALQGIAAYLRPSTDLHPVTRSTILPSRPTDRLYVDTAHVETARDYLSRLATEARETPDKDRMQLSGDEVDAAWEQIVAGYSDTAEKAEPEERREPPPRAYYRMAPPSRPRPTPDEPSLLDGLDTFGSDLEDEDDENNRFTPPIPPPVPRPSLPTVLAVVGIIGGLAVFLRPELLFFLDNGLSMFLGFTAIVTGFGTLVWRLRPGDEDDTDPDDGAKV